MSNRAVSKHALVAVTLGFLAAPASANNGLILIGTGAESVAMGGADVAVARDTTALSTNPAGLSQLRGWTHDGYLAAAFALDMAHEDRFGNDRRLANWVVPVTGAGVAKHLAGTGFTVGVGMFASGGAGSVYNELNTPFGGKDTLRALFGVVKLTPGFAWQASDALSLGMALNIQYASLEQRFFPNVSHVDSANPGRTFFGSEIRGASAVRLGGKVGMLYQAAPGVAVGLTYAPRLRIPFDNGRLLVNYAALGLGTVTYRRLRLDGLALPREVAAGVALQPTPRLTIAFDVAWFDYRHALRSQSLSASDPDDPRAPASIETTAALAWRNQTVVAVGLAYASGDDSRYYAGVNYGRNPGPSNTLNPLFSSIGEWHVTAGFSRRLSEPWSMTVAVEYLLPKTVAYDNPELPFGPGARERVSYVGVNLMFSRRW